MGIVNYTYNRSTSGGEIITHLINSTDGQGLDFADGALLQLAYAAGGVFGTGDFSVEFIIDQSSANSNHKVLYTSGGNSEFQITSETGSTKIELTFDLGNPGATDYDLSYDMSADYGSPVHYVLTFDRSALATLYKDGNSVATVDISGSSAVNLDNSGTAAGYLGGVAGYGVTGVFYRWRTWKKLLSAAEVVACYENASVPIVDQWTNCVTDLDMAFANPERSLSVRSRSGAGDATASVGIFQVTPIEQLNSKSISVSNATQRTPASGDIVADQVGVGIVPAAPLHVSAAGSCEVRINNSNDTKNLLLVSGTASSTAYVSTLTSAENLRLQANGGKVGINVPPLAQLHVKVAATTGTAPLEVARLECHDGGVDMAVGMGPKLSFYSPHSSASFEGASIAAKKEDAADANEATGLVFSTCPDAGSNTERLTIDSAGLVKTTGAPNTLGDSRYTMRVEDNTATVGATAGVGGGIIFSGSYNAANAQTNFAAIWGEKENVTPSSSNGQLHLGTRLSGSDISSDLVIDSTGLCSFSSGIAFQSATTGTGTSSEAFTLDKYETGLWTPVIGGGACTNLVGKYTRVGNKVTVTVSVLNGTLTGATTSIITGLPFTVGSARSTTSMVAYYNVLEVANPVGLLVESATQINMVSNTAGGTWATANFTNTATVFLHFSATYFV